MNDKTGHSVAIFRERNEGGWVILPLLPCYVLMPNPHPSVCLSLSLSVCLSVSLSVCLSVGQREHLSDSGVVFRRRFVPFYTQSPDSSRESRSSLPTADRYTHAHIHMLAHTCTHTQTHMHMHARTHTHTHMHALTHTHTHIHAHTHILRTHTSHSHRIYNDKMTDTD